ncbi:MAG: Oxidoreductase molybdopterin binding domain protein [Firmicutes bacterium ADurb.Bin456]|nr:MAG: Oxidoreductase molybdopterin binding domain protein [Firmicutes bacterium ADurb.Bin456]
MLFDSRKFRILLNLAMVFLLVIGPGLLTGCQGRGQDRLPAGAGKAPVNTGQETGEASSGAAVTIMGDGVEHGIKLTLAELKGLGETPAAFCYSTVNNWPAKKFVVGKGVKVARLLEQAGIKEGAQKITFRAADGYNVSLTWEQLTEKRFFFPGLLKGSPEEALEVPAILAWEYGEDTSDLSKVTGSKLRLLLGQKWLTDVATAAFVKDVSIIEVGTAPPGQWSAVQPVPVPGKVKRGTEIVLTHPQQDLVKIYYTIDGSTPDERSLVYNPSTTYYQPDLSKPIPVDKPVTIKTIVVGFGKHNSMVSTFKYDPE